MKSFNIYICGVGGQGIGILSEILLRGADYAGFQAKAVDTHGLAQRGGTVVSHLRLGEKVHSPMVSARKADLVIALERHEAIRGADTALKDNGDLIYFNTVLQPLGVRLGSEQEVSETLLQRICAARGVTVHKVDNDICTEPRMQNIVVLAHIYTNRLIPGIKKPHLLQAMEDLMQGAMLENNMALFNSLTTH